jgi:hypothetical protein
VDGTSASSPALAGIIGAYNLVRVDAGLPTLGFLNPLLYIAWNETRTAAPGQRAFFDIVNGTNRCLAAGDGCCTEGYDACAGFDPVTGLGSPDFEVLGPFLAPAPIVLNSNKSNYFFPTCTETAHSVWPPSPTWTSHPQEGGGGPNVLGIVIGVSFAVAAVGVIICLGCWWWQNKRSAIAVANRGVPQPGHAVGGAGGAGGEVALASPPSHHNWGPGRVLGSAASPDPAVNLAAPLSRGAQSDFSGM